MLLGPDHPDVATSLNNLALLYCYQDQYAQAEPLYQRALKINENTYGAEHPDDPRIALSLANLAGMYRTQGQYAQAEPLERTRFTDAGKISGARRSQGGPQL